MAYFQAVRGRSQISFAGQSTLHPIYTSTTDLEAFIEARLLDNGLPDATQPVTGRLVVQIESLKNPNALYDRVMEEVLDKRRYPRLIAEVVELKAKNGTSGHYQAVGDVNFHGVTQRLVSDLIIRSPGNQALEIKGAITLDMRDFKVNPPKMLMVRVFPEITVSLTLIAERTEKSI